MKSGLEIAEVISRVRDRYPHARLYYVGERLPWVIVEPRTFTPYHDRESARVHIDRCRELSPRCATSDLAWESVKCSN